MCLDQPGELLPRRETCLENVRLHRNTLRRCSHRRVLHGCEYCGCEWIGKLVGKGLRLVVRPLLDRLRSFLVRSTHASERPPLVAALKANRNRQAADKLAAGPAWQEHGYLFPTRVGTPEWGDNVLKRSLKPLVAAIGDPTLDFRKLRRSHSTFYAVLNVHPRVAQMSMGHGSFDTTMKYYTGVPADLQKRAAEVLGQLLFGCGWSATTRKASRPQTEGRRQEEPGGGPRRGEGGPLPSCGSPARVLLEQIHPGAGRPRLRPFQTLAALRRRRSRPPTGGHLARNRRSERRVREPDPRELRRLQVRSQQEKPCQFARCDRTPHKGF
jgi:hypothetical protein